MSDNFKLNIKEAKFSLWQGFAVGAAPVMNITAEELVALVQDDYDIKDIVGKLRVDPVGNKMLKKSLPAVTAFGTFSQRRMEFIESKSGYFIVDIDNIIEKGSNEYEKVELYKEELSKDKVINPMAIFTSPSGNGLKALIRVPQNADFNEYIRGVYSYLSSTYKDGEVDELTDISRLCFLSHDKDIYVNLDAPMPNVSKLREYFVATANEEETDAAFETIEQEEVRFQLQNIIQQLEQRGETAYLEDFQQWIKHGIIIANELEDEGEDYFVKLSSFAANFDENECRRKYQEILRQKGRKVSRPVRFGTLCWYAKENGIKLKRYGLSEEKTTIESFCMIGGQYYKSYKRINRMMLGHQEFDFVEPVYKKYSRTAMTDVLQDGSDLKPAEIIRMVKKYDDFTVAPDNMSYKATIGSMVNLYSENQHHVIEGKWDTTEQFLRHVFGDQYEMGLDYLTVMWRYPRHALPILALVSDEQNTGKSTFLDWLKYAFGNNATILSNSAFTGAFNSHYADKLVIGIDEVFFGADKRSMSERLKYLSTTKHISRNEKGVAESQVPFYGKFILTSNEADNFVNLDESDSRYWIRYVRAAEVKNANILAELAKELPAFLYELSTREISYKAQDRLWFKATDFRNDSWDAAVEGSKMSFQKQIDEYLEILEQEYPECRFKASDLAGLATIKADRYGNPTQIGKYLKRLGYVQINNVKGYQFYDQNTEELVPRKGKYYVKQEDNE